MLTIRAPLEDHLARSTFFERLHTFVAANARRDDWRLWMQDRQRLHRLWEPAWRLVRQQTEHDCAMVLVLVAIRAFEGHAPPDTEQLLAQVRANPVWCKNYVAGHGYLHFIAFDYPVGSLAQELEDV